MMPPKYLIAAYIESMRIVHGNELAQAIQLEYRKGFYRINVPMVGSDGEFIRIPTRNLRRIHIAQSIYKLSLRYQKEHKYMIPIAECTASRIGGEDQYDHSLGDLSIIVTSTGAHLVWRPRNANCFIHDPIVAVFVDNDYISLMATIDGLSTHKQASEFGIFIRPVNSEVKSPSFMFTFAPDQWWFFRDSLMAGRRLT